MSSEPSFQWGLSRHLVLRFSPVVSELVPGHMITSTQKKGFGSSDMSDAPGDYHVTPDNGTSGPRHYSSCHSMVCRRLHIIPSSPLLPFVSQQILPLSSPFVLDKAFSSAAVEVQKFYVTASLRPIIFHIYYKDICIYKAGRTD
jgi:hypothetical protein